MNAVITGATKGIGRAISDLLASKDINLGICSRNESELSSMKSQLLKSFPKINVFTKVTDMSNKDEVMAFANYLKKKMGNIDVIVNNAGVFIPGEVCSEADGSLETMIETNLYSAYHLTRSLLPAMKENAKGHIFNMCSVAGMMAYPNGGSYSISKFALYGFSKALREELKGKGIKVTSILPGATWSDSWKGADFAESRLMQASDIASLVWAAMQLSPSAVVEDIVIRPQLGDL